jgi:type I restriction enzyme S subunit
MKSGWLSQALGAVCQIKPPKSEARGRVSTNGVVSFLPMEDMGIDEKFVRARKTRPLSGVIGSYTYFADGDVLLAKITPCFENGKLGIAKGLTNGIGFGSSEYFVFRPDRTISKEWLYYYLSREEFRTEGAERMSGAVGHKRVSRDFVENYPIPIPPLPEQQRIVDILDKALEGLATTRADAEKNLQNSRALFESHLQSVFTQGDSNHKRFRLEDVCDDITVGHVGSMATRYKQSGIPFLRSQNIRPFRISLDNLVFIDEQFHRSLAKSALHPGDVAIVRTGYPGTAAVIPDSLPECNCSDLVIARPGKAIDSHYLALFFNSDHGKDLVAGRLVGAAQKHFNVTAAKQVAISLPSLVEQRRIVRKLDIFSAETRRLESIYHQKLTALDALKRSLLHHAFSGEL